MLDVFFSARFKRDYKLMRKQGRDLNLLLNVVDVLAAEKPLDPKYKDHPLTGDFAGHRECHVLPDWLLIYKPEKDRLVLTLTRTGTHSELFGK
jgi:mRNA interferase YafQ